MGNTNNKYFPIENTYTPGAGGSVAVDEEEASSSIEYDGITETIYTIIIAREYAILGKS